MARGGVRLIGKAPGRVIQLGGGHPQVKEHPVHPLHPGPVQQGRQVPKITVEEGDLPGPGGQAGPPLLQGLAVPVDTEQATAGGQSPDNRLRMPAPAQGAVYIDPIRADGQPLDGLLQQNRPVCVCSTH